MDTQSSHPVAGTPRVLLVLREPKEARRVASALERLGFETVQVDDDVAGYNLLDTEQVDALICETRAPRIDGLRLLRVAWMRNPDLCAILIATQSDIALATRGMEEGAHDFQTRPLNLEKIQAVVRRGLDTQRLVGEMHELSRRLDRKFGFRNLIGNSAPIVRVYNRILQICGNDDPVLIVGESGTGRSLVAAAIHQNSARRSGPLVRMDCGGFEAGVLDRELFGESAGKDRQAREGRIELAEGGTLILERLDELPTGAQERIIRLLRDREYEEVSGDQTIRADVRVLAISPPDMKGLVDSGLFHSELYDLLRAATIEMPTLRHRKRDIPLLVNHFLQDAQEDSDHQIEGIEPAAIDRLVRYSWPGNVRELKNVIRGLVETATGRQVLGLSDLPEEIREWTGAPDTEISVPIGTALAEVERRVIQMTLAHLGGDRRRTARILGIGLRTLQRRLAEYGVSKSKQ